MSNYYGFVVTDAGRELIAKLVAGQQLNISQIMVGSGYIPEGTRPAEMTALAEPVAAGTSNTPVYDGDSVRMMVEYRSDLNGGLDHGFWLREFGVFAYDPDKGEVMIYYGSLGDYPQYVSAKSSSGVDVRRFPVCIVIGEGLGVTVDYQCEAWMTAEDVAEYCTITMLPQFLAAAQELIDKHNEDPEAHHSIQNSVTDIDARVSLLELLLNTDVTGNPFTVTFAILEGTSVTGVWNESAKRIEF
jgi:hypothetical protein